MSYGLVGRGGDAVQMAAVIEALRAMGCDVTVAAGDRLRPFEFQGSGGLVRNIARRWPWWVRDLLDVILTERTLRAAVRLLRIERFDMVLYRSGMYDRPSTLATGENRLAVLLDAPFPVERAFRGHGYFGALHRRSVRDIASSADLVVTVSRESKRYYAERGIPADKVLVLPNGVSRRSLEIGSAKLQTSPPLGDPSRCVVGFVGSLSRWHRVDLLVEALLYLDREAGWSAEIVGLGEEYTRVRRLAAAIGLDSRITWTGALPHDQAFERIAGFDIAVLPHTLPTGAPMKLFEYAALARPIVAPDLPNLRDLFREDEMLFVPPEDPQALAEALRWLRDHPDKAREMGRRAQQRAQDYTWENWVRRLLAAVGLPR